MKYKKSLLVLLGLISIITLGLTAMFSFPKKIVTSTYKDYRVIIYQQNDVLKLQYFSNNSLSQEREISVKGEINKDSITINWNEDTIADNYGELYPKITLNVSVLTTDNLVLPFFEWTIIDWSKPK